MNGITHAVKTEAHLRIHFAFAGAALFLGWVLAASPTQWVGLLFAIGLVMSAELLNSAIEGLCDVVSPSYDARIGKVKDMAAGGVLICAVTAMAIGLIIFIPLIIEKIP
ncbi:MAG: diacylglycerol kinase family protein [Pseudomonadota bacterium]